MRDFKHLRISKTVILLLILAVIGISACGKRKAPLPLRSKISQRAVISGFQRGDQVILSWKMPERNPKRKDRGHIARIDVYRLSEPADSKVGITEEQFSSRSSVISTIEVDENDFGEKKLSYIDHLRLTGRPSKLHYAVRFVNASGQKAAFSNFITIEPRQAVAAAPTSLEHILSQDAVSLNWSAPKANADGTTPLNIAGYYIYRSSSRTEAAKPLNTTPVRDTEFADKTFEFEKEYFYFVRAVSIGSDGAPIESLESNIVEITPKDTFAPSAPASISIVSSPGTISIFFPSNPESDIAGYRIYRSEDANLPISDWKLLTPTILDTNTFQDEGLKEGTTYFYYLTAIDKAGNISPPSEVISETVMSTPGAEPSPSPESIETDKKEEKIFGPTEG